MNIAKRLISHLRLCLDDSFLSKGKPEYCALEEYLSIGTDEVIIQFIKKIAVF